MPLFSRQNPPKSLCILRLSAIGDVTHALAVVQEIARYYPECKITWIVGKTEYALLSAVTDLNLIAYDKKSGWKGIFALWKTLRAQKFDALLNMQTAFRASILSLGIKAKYKIGYNKTLSREGQYLFVNQQIETPQNPHVLDSFKAFAYKIGVPEFEPHWALNIPAQAQQKVRSFLSEDRPNLLISPCASKAERDWLVERYAEVANIAYQRGFNVILSGSPAARERETCEKITALCTFPVVNACGKTNLAELVALIAQADLLIAPDSGPAHIATMTNTKVIGLYAYQVPWRTGPYRDLDNVISVYETNAQKEFGKPSTELPWATKLKSKDLMAQIEVEDVIEKINHLIPKLDGC